MCVISFEVGIIFYKQYVDDEEKSHHNHQNHKHFKPAFSTALKEDQKETIKNFLKTNTNNKIKNSFRSFGTIKQILRVQNAS